MNKIVFTTPRRLEESGLLAKAAEVLAIKIFDDDLAIGLTEEQANQIGILDLPPAEASKIVDFVP